MKKLFREGKFIIEGIIRHGWDVTLAGTWGDWSHFALSQETDKCCYLGFMPLLSSVSPFYHSRNPRPQSSAMESQHGSSYLSYPKKIQYISQVILAGLLFDHRIHK